MNGRNMVEEHQRNVEEGHPYPESANILAAAKQCSAAQQQHDKLRGNGDGETQERQNNEGNGELREHGGEVGNRQRLPEENAAIAALSVQGVERVENPDDKSRPHDQTRR